MKDPSKFSYDLGNGNPYDGVENASASIERKIVLGVLADLTDRRGIKNELEQIDDDVRIELVESLTKIVAVGLKELKEQTVAPANNKPNKKGTDMGHVWQRDFHNDPSYKADIEMIATEQLAKFPENATNPLVFPEFQVYDRADRVAVAILDDLNDLFGEVFADDNNYQEEMIDRAAEIIRQGMPAPVDVYSPPVADVPPDVERDRLVNRIFENSNVYIRATDCHGMTINDRIHGAVYKALETLDEYVQPVNGAKPFPFDGNLAGDYGDKRDNDGHDTLGRTTAQLDRNLFD